MLDPAWEGRGEEEEVAEQGVLVATPCGCTDPGPAGQPEHHDRDNGACLSHSPFEEKGDDASFCSWHLLLLVRVVAPWHCLPCQCATALVTVISHLLPVRQE